ncbi:hypothetical protein P4S68_02370 [Pseudoalteromonas sp. Hal099]
MLLFIGYSSYIGSVGDGLLGVYALWVLISNNLALLSLSLNDFLAQYVEFIYWVKQVAFLCNARRLCQLVIRHSSRYLLSRTYTNEPNNWLVGTKKGSSTKS